MPYNYSCSLSLPKWIQRRLLCPIRRLRANNGFFYWVTDYCGTGRSLAHHVGDLDDYQETTAAQGHARINKSRLAASETVDFEAENQTKN